MTRTVPDVRSVPREAVNLVSSLSPSLPVHRLSAVVKVVKKTVKRAMNGTERKAKRRG